MDWCTIESDPGVFTEMIGKFGAEDVQVEEVYDVGSMEQLEQLKPVYGLVFLFKWVADSDARPAARGVPQDLFFAQQVINNACATQAILSILLNVPGLQLGHELEQFKMFTQDLPYDIRGMALANSDTIRSVHNSFARPEPIVLENGDDDSPKEDAFHFISYVPFKGRLYELDGLKKGPIDLGEVDGDAWINVARETVQKRIEKYTSSEIRFTLLALMKSRPAVLQERRMAANQRLMGIENKLARLNKTASPHQEGDESGLPDDADMLQGMLMECREEQSLLEDRIADEERKLSRFARENERRRHNYAPFVFQLLKVLADKGQLQGLVDQAVAQQTQQGSTL